MLTILIIACFFYVAGIVLMTLGVSLYHNEKEELSTSISGIIVQQAQLAAQPSVNESSIMASFAAVLIIFGLAKMLWQFKTTENWDWIGTSVYTAGWILFAFPAAMNNNGVNSLATERIAWTIPGIVLIIASTIMFPFFLRKHYISSPTFILMALGFYLLDIGISLVLTAPDQYA